MLLLRRGALKGIGRASAEDADAVGGGGDGPMGWWQRLVVVRVTAVAPPRRYIKIGACIRPTSGRPNDATPHTHAALHGGDVFFF